MTCGHDPMYRINNEAGGGVGCPICNRQRRMVMTYRNGVTAVDPDWVDQRNYIDKAQSVLPDVARMAEEIGDKYATFAALGLEAQQRELDARAARINAAIDAAGNRDVVENKTRRIKPNGYGMEVDG